MIRQKLFPRMMRCSLRPLSLALAIVAGCRFEVAESENAAPRNQPDNRTADRPPADAAPRSVRDLNRQLLDQLCRGQSKAVVFVFTRIECPISNRYAPEIRRLSEKFASQGVLFELVFPETSDSVAAIREHLTAFDYPCEAWRDPTHVAVRRFGAKVTPEVAVCECRSNQMIYRGRIDDLYVDFGQARRAPETHDLEDALDAVLTGHPVRAMTTDAVGCLISDLP
jgi:hypothetical protein